MHNSCGSIHNSCSVLVAACITPPSASKTHRLQQLEHDTVCMSLCIISAGSPHGSRTKLTFPHFKILQGKWSHLGIFQTQIQIHRPSSLPSCLPHPLHHPSSLLLCLPHRAHHPLRLRLCLRHRTHHRPHHLYLSSTVVRLHTGP
jgi:hypothetical protein